MEVTEAPLVHRATEIVCQFYQQFIYKTFTPKQLSRICTIHLRRSLCRRHLRDIVFMLSPPCSPPLCVSFICSRLTLSLHISEDAKMNRKVFTLLNVFSKKNTFKTKFLSGFINAQQSVAYKIAGLKVPNQPSKGRQ